MPEEPGTDTSMRQIPERDVAAMTRCIVHVCVQDQSQLSS